MLTATGSIILYYTQPIAVLWKTFRTSVCQHFLCFCDGCSQTSQIKQRPHLLFAPGWNHKLRSDGFISNAEKKFPSDALCKAAQTRRAAPCWINIKYLYFKYLTIYFTEELKGLFYDSVCPSFSFSVWFLVFRAKVAALGSARGMCPPTDRASCTRGQRSGKLSALLSEETQTDSHTWIIPFLMTRQLLWCSLFRLQRPCWCLQFFFLPSVFVYRDNMRL